MATEKVTEPAVAEPIVPQPLQTQTQQPVVSETNGLTVITQPGDAKAAQAEMDAQAPRLRGKAKPRISAPLMDAPAAEAESVVEPVAEVKPKLVPKPLQPGGERFEEAQRQKKVLFDENQALKAKLAALEKPAAEAATPAAAPKPERFPSQEQWFAQHPDKTFDDFLDARDDWRDTRKQAVQQTQTEQQALNERASTDWNRYVTQAQEIENFDQIVQDGLAAVPLNPNLQIAILQAPNGARIAHYLATHPEAAAELARLPVVDLYREVGALDAQFRSKPVGATATVIRSTAPAPFQPTGAGAAHQTTESFFDTAAKIGSKTTGTLRDYEALRRSHGMTGGRRRM